MSAHTLSPQELDHLIGETPQPNRGPFKRFIGKLAAFYRENMNDTSGSSTLDIFDKPADQTTEPVERVATEPVTDTTAPYNPMETFQRRQREVARRNQVANIAAKSSGVTVELPAVEETEDSVGSDADSLTHTSTTKNGLPIRGRVASENAPLEQSSPAPTGEADVIHLPRHRKRNSSDATSATSLDYAGRHRAGSHIYEATAEAAEVSDSQTMESSADTSQAAGTHAANVPVDFIPPTPGRHRAV